jgi:hypothetical protein
MGGDSERVVIKATKRKAPTTDPDDEMAKKRSPPPTDVHKTMEGTNGHYDNGDERMES